jgi:hypothetical protein
VRSRWPPLALSALTSCHWVSEWVHECLRVISELQCGLPEIQQHEQHCCLRCNGIVGIHTGLSGQQHSCTASGPILLCKAADMRGRALTRDCGTLLVRHVLGPVPCGCELTRLALTGPARVSDSVVTSISNRPHWLCDVQLREMRA